MLRGRKKRKMARKAKRTARSKALPRKRKKNEKDRNRRNLRKLLPRKRWVVKKMRSLLQLRESLVSRQLLKINLQVPRLRRERRRLQRVSLRKRKKIKRNK